MSVSGLRNLGIAIVCIAAGVSSKSAVAQGAALPCDLLTVAQVGAAVGTSVSAPQAIGSTGCSWSAPHIIVSVSLMEGGKWQQMKAPQPGITHAAIGGLGDDAFSATTGKPDKQFVTLNIKKGDTAYVFKVYGVNATRQAVMEHVLAANVLAKL